MTDDQLHTLRHMLGINTPDDRKPRPYRDYAAVNPGDPEFGELERLGAVERVRRPAPDWAYGYAWYQCTEAGKAAAMASHRRIRKGKPQRVYLAYLSCRDCCPDLTFKEFLTDPEFDEERRQA